MNVAPGPNSLLFTITLTPVERDVLGTSSSTIAKILETFIAGSLNAAIVSNRKLIKDRILDKLDKRTTEQLANADAALG